MQIVVFYFGFNHHNLPGFCEDQTEKFRPKKDNITTLAVQEKKIHTVGRRDYGLLAGNSLAHILNRL